MYSRIELPFSGFVVTSSDAEIILAGGRECTVIRLPWNPGGSTKLCLVVLNDWRGAQVEDIVSINAFYSESVGYWLDAAHSWQKRINRGHFIFGNRERHIPVENLEYARQQITQPDRSIPKVVEGRRIVVNSLPDVIIGWAIDDKHPVLSVRFWQRII